MPFSSKLIYWYQQNKRALPWRQRKDPYAIWISEIILQQTRVDQGLAYYEAFINHFPTIHDLAAAEEQEVLKLWQGLGYYSRARNLHHTARYIAENLQGVFPGNYSGLLKLKGVGDYTASAVSSICYGEPQAVVDGNVYRVLSRFFGVKTPINTSKGIKTFKDLAQNLMDKDNPGDFNQAIMEFGAIQCKPKNPDCSNCIFNASCYAFLNREIEKLPIKTSKTKVKKRYFNYLVVLSVDNKTLLEKRTGSDIWKNLYQFPLIEKETNEPVNLNEIKKLLNLTSLESAVRYDEKPLIHKLSHQHLNIHFWIIHTPALIKEGIAFSEIKKYPVPIALHNFITNFPF